MENTEKNTELFCNPKAIYQTNLNFDQYSKEIYWFQRQISKTFVNKIKTVDFFLK